VFPQYKLKTLLIGFVIVSVLLCIYVIFRPPANPEDQEGWDWGRVIRSKQALEVIESPDKITVSAIEPVLETDISDFESESKIIVVQTLVLKNPELINKLTEALVEIGKRRKKVEFSALVEYDIRLDFSRASSTVHVYVSFLNPDYPFFAVFERSFLVGRYMEAPSFIKIAEEVCDELLAKTSAASPPVGGNLSGN